MKMNIPDGNTSRHFVGGIMIQYFHHKSINHTITNVQCILKRKHSGKDFENRTIPARLIIWFCTQSIMSKAYKYCIDMDLTSMV